jgi:hypothetical protein
VPDERYMTSTLAAANDPPMPSVKSLVLNPSNPERALPQINGTVTLLYSRTGMQPHRFAVYLRFDPPRIVLGSDREVRVTELPRHVPELHTGRQQLVREGVAQILETSVADLGALENPAPLD